MYLLTYLLLGYIEIAKLQSCNAGSCMLIIQQNENFRHITYIIAAKVLISSRFVGLRLISLLHLCIDTRCEI